jgi:hypothetical protein
MRKVYAIIKGKGKRERRKRMNGQLIKIDYFTRSNGTKTVHLASKDYIQKKRFESDKVCGRCGKRLSRYNKDKDICFSCKEKGLW